MNIDKGSLLGEHHRVIDILGEGGYGFVTKCLNTETEKMEAIKIIKGHISLRQAKKEIKILRKLQCLDPDTCHIVKWNGDFFSGGNLCLNFELLDQSLHDFSLSRERGLLMSELRSIIFQLATALFHLGSLGIIHADLKPENVMVADCRQHSLKVKLIDFGLAQPVGICKDWIQTLWYRAPEVILGIPFNEAIDMWSLGLTVAELKTQQPVYPGIDEQDMMTLIIEKQGQPSDDLLDRGRHTHLYFEKQSNRLPHWRLKRRYNALERIPSGFKFSDLSMLTDGNASDHRHLQDLIINMLQLDAANRFKPLEVLQHPFFTHKVPQSPIANVSMEMDADKEIPKVIPPSSCWTGDHPSSPKNRVTENTKKTPSSFYCLSGGGLGGQQPKQTGPNFPLSGQLFQGNPEVLPVQPRDIVPPACSESSPGPPPIRMFPEYLIGEASRRHPDQMSEPPHLTPLNVEENTAEHEHRGRTDNGATQKTGGVKSKTSAKKSSCFGRCFRKICSFFRDIRNQHSAWFQAVDPNDSRSRIENVFAYVIAKESSKNL